MLETKIAVGLKKKVREIFLKKVSLTQVMPLIFCCSRTVRIQPKGNDFVNEYNLRSRSFGEHIHCHISEGLKTKYF